VVTAVEVMGFGTSAKGVTSFINSTSLIGDLGTRYITSWLGNVITIGAMVSAFSCALACTVGAARLTYAMGRDGVLPAALGTVSPRRSTPIRASLLVVLAVYVVIAFTWFGLRGDPFTLFLQAGVIGTLILLVVYVLATVGMVRLVFFSGPAADRPRVRMWEIVIPVLGIIVLGYTLFRNVWPLPTGVNWWGPSVAVAWLVLGIVGVLLRPGATRRAGQHLLKAEGLTAAPAGEPAKLVVEGESPA
jgi:amino acid transporter